MNRFDYLKNVRTVVVKVGSSTITHDTGLLDLGRIEHIVRDLVDIKNMGYEVVLVTSGAIAAGVGALSLDEKPDTLPQKQAAAAVGQLVLMHMYQKIFSEYGKIIGQILLTKDDIKDENRLNNAKNTFTALLNAGVIPIVNENDAVVVDEIKVGDNDTLSAYVTEIVEAELLIILSDIDGLYTDNPRENPNAKLISVINRIDDDVKALGKGAGSSLGTGGMETKLIAGEIAANCNASMVIALGSREGVLRDIMSGEEVGTLFRVGK
ncbi:MAG: glutamate 5-kinase [Acidaminobacteraceae bacterium]